MADLTATHQAGHVVMAWLCGLAYETVSLTESCARCHDAGLADIDDDDEVNILTRADVILAGPLAEAGYPRDLSTSDRDDLDYATDLLRSLGLSHLSDEAEDVLLHLADYRSGVERVARLLSDGRTHEWGAISRLLGPPGRSLSVEEQRARYRSRVLHRISERLDCELHGLEPEGLPPELRSNRWSEVDARCRSVWARWIESGQEAMRLRHRETEKRGDRTMSVVRHPRALCRADFRLADIAALRYDHFVEEEHAPTQKEYLMGDVDCDLMVGGYLCHSCPNGPPPHRLQVIVSERSNDPEIYDGLVATAKGRSYEPNSTLR